MSVSFELTDDQRELRDLAHDFAERELRPIAAECDARSEFPNGLLERAARAGLTSYAIPEEYGGGGVSALTASLMAEELSWGCAGLAGSLSATMFPVRPLLNAGTKEQRERYLPLLSSENGALAAIAFTEPHAGSDLSAIRATAVREGDEYVLNGEKCYVTNGGIAAVTVVFAKVDGGMTAFVFENGDPGVSPGRKEDKLGLRASYTGSIVLEDARIPAERRLGEEGQGLPIALDFFEASRPQVAAAAVGVARAAFEYAAEYARGPRRSASRSWTSRASPSSSPTWRWRSRPRACSSGARATRSTGAGRRPPRLLCQGVRRGRGDARHDRGRPDPRRRGDHGRPSCREVVPGREGVPDRRGHIGDPAADRCRVPEKRHAGACSPQGQRPEPPIELGLFEPKATFVRSSPA